MRQVLVPVRRGLGDRMKISRVTPTPDFNRTRHWTEGRFELGVLKVSNYPQ
jgi:hypothetical protein